MQFDYLIIGSGFGGSVSALRLAEKGWKVGIIEQGKKVDSSAIKKAKQSVFKLMWKPRMGMRGYFIQHMFPNLSIVGGVGVGGGSLVWGAVMLEPKQSFYEDEKLQTLGVDWQQELAPHFVEAKRMLGVNTNPRHTLQDDYLKQTASALGKADTFGPVPNAIYFNTDSTQHDPYFDGTGPQRNPCNFCGGCLTGCPEDAKNSLNFNYLHFAQQRGVELITETEVTTITPLPIHGYAVTTVSPYSGREPKTYITDNLILSAGVVGTLNLLFKNKMVDKTLPNISDTLGKVVRTNSEAITAVLHPEGEDLSDGTAISSDFYPDSATHVTQNRFDRGYRFMRFLMVPLTDGDKPLKRAFATLGNIIRKPSAMFKNWFIKDWEKRMTVFTIMQDLDNHLEFNFKRRWWSGFQRALSTEITSPEHAPPSYLPVANEVTKEFAKLSKGIALNTSIEAIGGMSTTAHILSGCPMGKSAKDSTIDTNHQVHGYPGLYVVDGSSIPANIGVNPSLTITAMAERFTSLQPKKTHQPIVLGG